MQSEQSLSNGRINPKSKGTRQNPIQIPVRMVEMAIRIPAGSHQMRAFLVEAMTTVDKNANSAMQFAKTVPRKGIFPKFADLKLNPKKMKKHSTGCISIMATETDNADWFIIPVQIKGIEYQMKMDTASQITIITSSTWEKLGKPELQITKMRARNCNGEKFDLKGKFDCSVANCANPLTVYVADSIAHDLLGIPWIQELQILPANLIPNTATNPNILPSSKSKSKATNWPIQNPISRPTMQFTNRSSIQSIRPGQNANPRPMQILSSSRTIQFTIPRRESMEIRQYIQRQIRQMLKQMLRKACQNSEA